MVDFSHLQKLQVKRTTQDFILYQIEDQPVLRIESAGESNKGYFNALLKQNKDYARRIRAGGGMTAAMLKKNRDEDRELYAKYVVKGWDGVTEKNGEVVPFSQNNCSEFLKLLPDWIIDEIRTFASDPTNFIDLEEPTEEDDRETGND